MTVTKEYLLSLMPPDKDEWVVVKEEQVVKDIIKQLRDAYPFSAPMYDKIGWCFEADTIEEICDELYSFCINNIRYEAEDTAWQSSSLPNGILNKGQGDCKAYASFIGGVLGALNRSTDDSIDWAFRFVSYDPAIRTPYHVFIVVFTPNGEIWVDPTPGTAAGRPIYPQTVRVKETMALMQQIAGISVDGSGQLVQQPERVGTTGDPSADTALAVANSISTIINQQNLRGTYLGNWLSDFANPGRALSDLGHLLFGYKYTGGDYALGEIFIDRVLLKPTSNRWDTPDAIVPLAWYYFTELFGLPIAVNTDLDTLVHSGNLQDYLNGRPEQTGYVTQEQVTRANIMLNSPAFKANSQYGDKYGPWPPEIFSLMPYAGPIPDARRPGQLFTGTLPNGQAVVNGYPVSAATKGGNIAISTPAGPVDLKQQRLKQALLVAAVGLALWVLSDND